MKTVNNLFGGIFNGRKILITGHTGFKGSWLSLVLHLSGAELYGYSLDPSTDPNLFELARINELMKSYIGDIRDYENLLKNIQQIKPEIIIHMAARTIVRDSYKDPPGTYSVNVIGTVNLLEAIRHTPGIKAVVNVTTDKCYENREWFWGYRENEPLGGYDPYSSSKSCSELVTSSYRNSFFNRKDYSSHGIALASARAGNVIGGGDWAPDRLVPDFVRSINNGEQLLIRNPHSIRPWQHVLESLTGYLMLTEKLLTEGPDFADAWNFGPVEDDSKNVEWMADTICKMWGNDAEYMINQDFSLHEANYLKLDCSKARSMLGWSPKWTIHSALEKTVNWYKAVYNGGDARRITLDQIKDYYGTS